MRGGFALGDAAGRQVLDQLHYLPAVGGGQRQVDAALALVIHVAAVERERGGGKAAEALRLAHLAVHLKVTADAHGGEAGAHDAQQPQAK